MSALRSLVPSSARRLGAVAGPSAPLRASSFATSSRVGLDYTLPRFSSTTTTTTTTADSSTPSSSNSFPAPPPSPSATSAPSPSTPPPRASASKPSASQPSLLSSLSSPPRKSGKEFRWSPMDVATYTDAMTSSTRGLGQAPRNPTHLLTITSSRNNVTLTFSDRMGPLFPTITAGSGKSFKGAARSSYEAAHQAALKMFAKIDEHATSWTTSRFQPREETGRSGGLAAVQGRGEDRSMKLLVAYSGIFGQGREAVHSALSGPEGTEIRASIVRVEDRTPIKIGGTRARRARRL